MAQKSLKMFSYGNRVIPSFAYLMIMIKECILNCQVLTALRFYGTGSYQGLVGSDVTSTMSQSSVSRTLAEVTTAINNIMLNDDWISFPTSPREQNIEKQK